MARYLGPRPRIAQIADRAPITIGLAFLVAGFETAWLRSGDDRWLRLTKFYGKLFLINFAMGVVTGIVQKFQFGMNWSAYSRFVGDIFGAPLAIEALERASRTARLAGVAVHDVPSLSLMSGGPMRARPRT